MLKGKIKTIAKKNRTFAELYSFVQFMRGLPASDLLRPVKLSTILTVKSYTKLTYPRLSKLYDAACALEKERIPGNFVECGVWNGGSAGVISLFTKYDKNKSIWLLDSWEGLPEPKDIDVNYDGGVGEKGMAFGSQEKAEELLFRKLNLDKSKIHLIKGWFEKTIPANKSYMGRISLLHLDCDWYESIKFCLEQLYDNIVEGGFVFIDDYYYWKGCKKAVDEFIESGNIKANIIKIDDVAAYFRKPFTD